MTNKEMIIDILKDYSCVTSFQIKGFIYRRFGVSITPQAVAGTLRPLIGQGFVGKSVDPNSGKMAYWFTDFGRKELVK